MSNKWASYYLLENVIYFGKKGGFSAIVQRMKDMKNKCDLSVMSIYIQIISSIQTQGYFKRQFIEPIIIDIRDIIVSYLMAFSDQELKNIKRDEYEKLIGSTNRLLESVKSKPLWAYLILFCPFCKKKKIITEK